MLQDFVLGRPTNISLDSFLFGEGFNSDAVHAVRRYQFDNERDRKKCTSLNEIKKRNGFSFLILAHCPKRNAFRPLTKNDLQGSMMIMNFVDSAFSIWLISHFHPMEATAAIRKYKIGGHVLWNNATVFWQIDRQNRVHAGKIMLYDSHTGHRIKSPNSRISWVHTQPGFRNFNIRQCLFGLHLLGPETETVAIVEAEKTAVVASMFFPDVLFLATGGITNLRKETCEPLKDRRVILFPELRPAVFCIIKPAHFAEMGRFFIKYSLGIWEN